MHWLPNEILALIYAFDGRYKRYMQDCFSIIDVQKHAPLTRDVINAPEDMTPYNLLRKYYHNYIDRFGFKRTPMIPKNGIEVLNPVWVEQNRAIVSIYMKL